jgi:hypothetical protein
LRRISIMLFAISLAGGLLAWWAHGRAPDERDARRPTADDDDRDAPPLPRPPPPTVAPAVIVEDLAPAPPAPRGPMPRTIEALAAWSPKFRAELPGMPALKRAFAGAKLELLPLLTDCLGGRIAKGTVEARAVFKLGENDRTYDADRIEFLSTTLPPAERAVFETCVAASFKQSLPITDNQDVDETYSIETRFELPVENDPIFSTR